MGAILKSFGAKLYISIEQRAHLFEPRIRLFAIVAVIAFPVYYVVWHRFFPQPYENLALRLTGSLLFVPLVFVGRWPHWARRYLGIYWYLALLYGLPFFFTFMLLKNGGATAWLLSALIATFLMILLLDWLNLLIQSFLGVFLAWAAYHFTSGAEHHGLLPSEDIPIYLFAIIFGSIANYSAEMLQQERRRAMLAAASNIAHELRTPLLGIKSGAAGLRQYLPTLLETYQLAKDHELPVTPIRHAHMYSMQGVLDRIVSEADHSNTIIDMLLMNTRAGGLKPETLSICSISQCMQMALERYPFSSANEGRLIEWHAGTDFDFRGIELLMVHVMFNLMKNSLYAIAKAGKGRIVIHTQRGAQANILIFRDSGAGIPAEVMPHIFTPFYSWSSDGDRGLGAGVGLAFCRSVMKAFGGAIACESKLGEYTEFTLAFPHEQA